MKTFLFALLFSTSAFAQDAARSATFVAPSGCVWNAEAGSCIVSNTFKQPITCDVRTQITTEKDQVTRKAKMIIMPGEADTSTMFSIAVPNDRIITAKIAVKCQLTK